MDLKIKRYKNYGMTMSSDQDESGEEHRFYWSFYELNNKIIVFQHIEFWQKNVFIDSQFDYSYGESELKNGKIHKYKFGQDFFEWFDSSPPVKNLKKLNYPTQEEEICVKEFYSQFIESKRHIETDIIVH